MTDIAIAHKENISEDIGEDLPQNAAYNKNATIINLFGINNSINLYKKRSQSSYSNSDESMSNETIHLVLINIDMLEKTYPNVPKSVLGSKRSIIAHLDK